MKRNARGVTAIRPDAEGNLLRHRPAGQKDRLLLPEQRRDLALEIVDQLAFAVPIRLFVRSGFLGKLGQHISRMLHTVSENKSVAPAKCLVTFGVSARDLHDG
jgi:hypothetical protein